MRRRAFLGRLAAALGLAAAAPALEAKRINWHPEVVEPIQVPAPIPIPAELVAPFKRFDAPMETLRVSKLPDAESWEPVEKVRVTEIRCSRCWSLLGLITSKGQVTDRRSMSDSNRRPPP